MTASKKTPPALKADQRTMLEEIVRLLEDKKAESVRVLDLRGLSTVADFFVFASGTSTPHLKALADHVGLTLKQEGQPAFRIAGDATSGWVVLDLVDAVVHLMTPDTRSYYDLERLWSDAVPVSV